MTHELQDPRYQKSLMMIKPLAFYNNLVGHILTMVENAGFDIIAIKSYNLSKRQAELFYAVHSKRAFFDELTDYMASGKIAAICLGKINCIEEVRNLVGNTDPHKAADGTIRHIYGTNIQENAVHASDSQENALQELRFFFSDMELDIKEVRV